MESELIQASAHKIPIPDKSVHCIACSPPYWGLRVYDGDQAVEWPEVRYKPMRTLPEIVIPAWRGGLGNEPTPEMYIGHLILCLREWGRVLRDDGVCWVNLGDSYAGSGKGGHSAEKLSDNWQPKYTNKGNTPAGLKPKDLVGIPWAFAFAAQAGGWWLRSDVIWAKANSMPESVTDRPTRSHENIFMLTKSKQYFFDHVAIKEPLKESSIQRVSQKNFWNQTGGEKDYANGVNSNRSMRRSFPNFAASIGAPDDLQNDESFMGEMQMYISDEVRTEVHPPTPPKFGGNKADGYESRLYSGNGWEPDAEAGANKRDVWAVDEDSHSFVRFCAERGIDMASLMAEYNEAADNRGDLWRLATKPYKGAHFAAWPEDLVRPMILASTSAKGVCPHCGAQWERVIEKVGEYKARWKEGATVVDAQWGGVGASSAIATGNVAVRQTTGWRPTCDCPKRETIPATVLDPFNGSGTTGKVSLALGRNYIGVDLCIQYLENLSTERMSNLQTEMTF